MNMLFAHAISACLSLLLASTLNSASQAEQADTAKIRVLIGGSPTQAERDAGLTAMATAQTKMLDKDRADWGPNDKRWPAIFERVRSDLAVVLSQGDSQQEAALQTYLSNISAEITSSDIDAMLAFYQTAAGARYQVCVRRLDLIVLSGSASFFEKNRAPERATPEELSQFVRLLQLSHVFQADVANQEEDRAAGRDMSGYGLSSFMLAGTINRYREALKALSAEFASDLEAFEKFNKTDAARRFFVAVSHANKKRVWQNGKGAFTDLIDALKPRQLEWKALYSSSVAP